MATEMSLRVGKRIRQRREELGIRTQRELADLIPSDSVTNQTINKWEKGANEPGPRYKTMLAEALKVDIAYFIAAEPKGATPDIFPAGDSQLDRIERRLVKIEQLLSGPAKPQTVAPETILQVVKDLRAQGLVLAPVAAGRKNAKKGTAP